jgi:hypothetical protein
MSIEDIMRIKNVNVKEVMSELGVSFKPEREITREK